MRDVVIVLDWSSGNDTGPRERKDAIWAGVVVGGAARTARDAQPARRAVRRGGRGIPAAAAEDEHKGRKHEHREQRDGY